MFKACKARIKLRAAYIGKIATEEEILKLKEEYKKARDKVPSWAKFLFIPEEEDKQCMNVFWKILIVIFVIIIYGAGLYHQSRGS